MGDTSSGSTGGELPERRRRMTTAFGPGGWARRQARLWGFLAFVLLVLVLARQVILPFVFASLLAYVLAPVVQRMSITADGQKRMPKGVAIVLCYIVLLSFIAGFFTVLYPRLSKDAARIGAEAPNAYSRLNDVWAPKAARWWDKTFPSMAPKPAVVPDPGAAPLPSGTAFVVTPMVDGRYAIQFEKTGLEIRSRPGGVVSVKPAEKSFENMSTEDKMRAWAKSALASLQSQMGEFFRFGKALIRGMLRGVFTFFLVLMVAAFILLDLEKLHGFARNLFPQRARDDYDVIVAGIDRGLSGVIRGQLLVCGVNGVLTYIGMVIFGVKYAVMLAVVAALLSLIPIFGSILSSIPVVLVAMVSGEEGIELAKPLFILGWIVGIHFLEANFLNPKIIGRAAKMHPVLVIFSLIVGEHSYGLVGALLAVPVASIIQVLFLFFRDKAWKTDPTLAGVSNSG